MNNGTLIINGMSYPIDSMSIKSNLRTVHTYGGSFITKHGNEKEITVTLSDINLMKIIPDMENITTAKLNLGDTIFNGSISSIDNNFSINNATTEITLYGNFSTLKKIVIGQSNGSLIVS